MASEPTGRTEEDTAWGRIVGVTPDPLSRGRGRMRPDWATTGRISGSSSSGVRVSSRETGPTDLGARAS